MSESDCQRLFITLPVAETVRVELERFQSEFKKALPKGIIRWTPPDQFHLTLRFLGEVAVHRIGALTETLRAACVGVSSIALKAIGVGCFPDLHSPRVLWIGVQDDTRNLETLQKVVASKTAEFTDAKLEKHYAGHVTIGRVKQIKPPQTRLLSGLIREQSQRIFGQWRASEVKLMRSTLSDSGATHEDVSTIVLQQKG